MFKEKLYRRALQLYLGDAVLNRIDKYGEEALRLGGDVKTLTIYFQGLSAPFTPSLSPEELVQFLFEYANVMTETILSNNGILDKFINNNNAIMAYWGTDDSSNHAANACKCAIQCSEKADSIISKWSKDKSITLSVGINTGRVVVGNFGSTDRIQYSIMGDHVNLASIIEGKNKHYETRILISEYTKEQLSGTFSTREVDSVQIFGDQIKIYAIETISS